MQTRGGVRLGCDKLRPQGSWLKWPAGMADDMCCFNETSLEGRDVSAVEGSMNGAWGSKHDACAERLTHRARQALDQARHQAFV